MHIQAFRGLRYDLGQVGSLSEVVAPSAETIDEAERDELYERHPANAVRLVANRNEPGDDGYSNPILRAGRFLNSWRKQGLLVHESDPAIYVYHHSYDVDGVRVTRRGFICRVRLEQLGTDCIHASQQTSSERVNHWQQLTEACKSDISPISAVYADGTNEAQAILENSIVGQTPLEAVPDLLMANVSKQAESTNAMLPMHRLWPVTDVNVIAEFAAAMGSRTTILVAGHDCYQAALNQQAAIRATGNIDNGHAANFALMHCTSLSEPDLQLRCPYRMYSGLSGTLTTEQLHGKLADLFECRDVGEGSSGGEAVLDQLDDTMGVSECALFVPNDQRWTIARATSAGFDRLGQLHPDRSERWRRTSLNLVHSLIAESLLGLNDPSRVMSIDSTYQLRRGLERLGADAAARSLVTLVRPPSLDQFQRSAEAGELLPHDSVRLGPSPLSGLVINPTDA